MTKRIPVSRGLFALVDDEDYELVSRHKWQADPNHGTTYARTAVWTPRHRTFSMHRLILGLPEGSNRGIQVDHINGDGLENRRQNLRIVNQSQNMANRKKQSKAITSRFKGVARHKNGQWVAQIGHDGVLHYLGSFLFEEAAAFAYDSSARFLFSSFARTNLTGEGLVVGRLLWLA